MKEAKKLLCNNDTVKKAIPGKYRKGPSVQLVLDDMWACWKKLSDAKLLPKFITESSAISKIPMIHPSEETDQTRDERLQNLEQMVSVLVQKNIALCEQMNTLVEKNNNMCSTVQSLRKDLKIDKGKQSDTILSVEVPGQSWAERFGARPRDKTPNEQKP